MGAILGGLGLGGGAGGTGFANPQAVDVSNNQINTAYGNTQTAMNSQNQLLAALQAQNGLANQSSVYNQLQGIANGTGPNPAQAMLNQATAANTANQAALMASQRGTNANAGLIARQAAQQGAANQQAAAGQGATLQAQQSLNALNNMGSVANTQAGQQIGQTNANTAAQQAEQSNLLNAQISSLNSQNAANASMANQRMGQQSGMIGGAMKAAGAAAPYLAMLAAEGGQVPKKMAAGGPASEFGQFLSGVGIQNSSIGANAQNASAPTFFSPQAPGAPNTNMAGGPMDQGAPPPNANPAADTMATPMPANIPGNVDPSVMLSAHGGKVPALVSPGERFLKPKDVKKVEKGANPLQVGEKIPGTPKYPGNDYRNDIVPKKLDSGGIVIPNKVLQSANPAHEAKKFVAAVLAKNNKRLPAKR